MNAIIVYKGKYGATRQYANWLGRELGIIVTRAEKIKGEQLKKYDMFLVGSSVYIGQLQIKKWLKRNLEFLRNKKIFFFQVAGTPPQEREKRQGYNLAGIPAELIKDCEFYFLAGRMSVQKLSTWDRFLLKMGARMTKDPVESKRMLTDYDDVKKNNLDEMINGINKYLTPKRTISSLIVS